eukprot:Blabericola_migrator_1__9057@NODE_481_length_8138_cov_55_758146_g374_i0_p5_GENE_NODE_481_length_8138_cov_55_758146_g374_i0NODE_481_length_8138_cov_55_758146_g374_i0_p5_ORF_typecomplete_len228_score17_17CCCAP/PF15964_5/1_6e02CCCAP/PF15964_5/0_0015Filament/PF00038_21/0_002ZapB/PF06005_12/0_005HisKA_3/PF07730_13/4_1e03HisKA_3/PF07730_13/0_012Not3/PF04065_15/4_7e03Not3/PF04065_15/0_017Snf7/PF03357_21/0_037SFassemblin/PF06705_11/21SFassemblin/PF06705_11/0_48TSC22/PF01166_18/0_11Ax_dynein_light/PF1021
MQKQFCSMSTHHNVNPSTERKDTPKDVPSEDRIKAITRESQKLLHLVETRTHDLTDDEKDVLNSICDTEAQAVSLSYLIRLQPSLVYDCHNADFLRKLLFQVLSLNKSLFSTLTSRHREQTKIEKDAFQVEHILRRTIGSLQRQKDELESQISVLRSEADGLRRQAESERVKILRKLAEVKSHLDEALPELASPGCVVMSPQLPVFPPEAPPLNHDRPRLPEKLRPM